MAKSLNGNVRKDITVTPSTIDQSTFQGKTAIIVGGTGGLGRAIAQQMAGYGAKVTVVGRTFKDADVDNIEFIQADLSSLKKAKEVALAIPEASWKNADYVFLTTGIFAGRKRVETEEGIELDMAVSYLSRFVILDAIKSILGEQRAGSERKTRVFVMGFPGMDSKFNLSDFNSENKYQFLEAHYNTIAGNEALVSSLDAEQEQFNIYGLNPGLIKSDIRTELTGKSSMTTKAIEWLIDFFNQDADTYAGKIVKLLASDDLENLSGTFFNRNALPISASPNLELPETLHNIIDESRRLSEKALG